MDLPSDSDESDADFVPDEEVDNETGNKNKKEQRKRSGVTPITRSKRSKLQELENNKDASEKSDIVQSTDKTHEDSLWASFLNNSKEEAPLKHENDPALTCSATTGPSAESKMNETIPLAVKKQIPLPKPRVGGGLSSVLGKIGKNNKLSTLEKSKLDWNNFKQEQGIEEEISTHNRGRDGYLERQDFLQRTDLRQFEIEKDIRSTKRSNR